MDNRRGIISIWLIFLLILVAVFGGWFVFARPSNQPVPKPAPAPKTEVKIEDTDLSKLEKYCREEALKLPEVPFTYKSKTGPLGSTALPWVMQFIPENKKISGHKSCTMTYFFDGRAAYGQMGAVYPDQGQKFDRAVRAGIEAKLDSSWKRVSGPMISEDAFNMVYKRENPAMGTVDFVDAFDGGLNIFIKFNTYYK